MANTSRLKLLSNLDLRGERLENLPDQVSSTATTPGNRDAASIEYVDSRSGNRISITRDFRLLHRGEARPLRWDASVRALSIIIENQEDARLVYQQITGVANAADGASNPATQDVEFTFENAAGSADDVSFTPTVASIEPSNAVTLELGNADTYPGFAHPAFGRIEILFRADPAFASIRAEAAALADPASSSNFGNNQFTISVNGSQVYGPMEELVGDVEIVDGRGLEITYSNPTSTTSRLEFSATATNSAGFVVVPDNQEASIPANYVASISASEAYLNVSGATQTIPATSRNFGQPVGAWQRVVSGGGATNTIERWEQLQNTPASFTGSSGDYIVVNNNNNGLTFMEPPTPTPDVEGSEFISVSAPNTGNVRTISSTYRERGGISWNVNTQDEYNVGDIVTGSDNIVYRASSLGSINIPTSSLVQSSGTLPSGAIRFNSASNIPSEFQVGTRFTFRDNNEDNPNVITSIPTSSPFDVMYMVGTFGEPDVSDVNIYFRRTNPAGSIKEGWSVAGVSSIDVINELTEDRGFLVDSAIPSATTTTTFRFSRGAFETHAAEFLNRFLVGSEVDNNPSDGSTHSRSEDRRVRVGSNVVNSPASSGDLTYSLETGPAYSNTALYGQGDLVVYNNQLYISLQTANIGNTPDTSPTFWDEQDPRYAQVDVPIDGTNLPNTIADVGVFVESIHEINAAGAINLVGGDGVNISYSDVGGINDITFSLEDEEMSVEEPLYEQLFPVYWNSAARRLQEFSNAELSGTSLRTHIVTVGSTPSANFSLPTRLLGNAAGLAQLVVEVDGTAQTRGATGDYTVDSNDDGITFTSGNIPATGNVVSITYAEGFVDRFANTAANDGATPPVSLIQISRAVNQTDPIRRYDISGVDRSDNFHRIVSIDSGNPDPGDLIDISSDQGRFLFQVTEYSRFIGTSSNATGITDIELVGVFDEDEETFLTGNGGNVINNLTLFNLNVGAITFNNTKRAVGYNDRSRSWAGDSSDDRNGVNLHGRFFETNVERRSRLSERYAFATGDNITFIDSTGATSTGNFNFVQLDTIQNASAGSTADQAIFFASGAGSVNPDRDSIIMFLQTTTTNEIILNLKFNDQDPVYSQIAQTSVLGIHTVGSPYTAFGRVSGINNTNRVISIRLSSINTEFGRQTGLSAISAFVNETNIGSDIVFGIITINPDDEVGRSVVIVSDNLNRNTTPIHIGEIAFVNSEHQYLNISSSAQTINEVFSDTDAAIAYFAARPAIWSRVGNVTVDFVEAERFNFTAASVIDWNELISSNTMVFQGDIFDVGLEQQGVTQQDDFWFRPNGDFATTGNTTLFIATPPIDIPINYSSGNGTTSLVFTGSDLNSIFSQNDSVTLRQTLNSDNTTVSYQGTLSAVTATSATITFTSATTVNTVGTSFTLEDDNITPRELSRHAFLRDVTVQDRVVIHAEGIPELLILNVTARDTIVDLDGDNKIRIRLTIVCRINEAGRVIDASIHDGTGILPDTVQPFPNVRFVSGTVIHFGLIENLQSAGVTQVFDPTGANASRAISNNGVQDLLDNQSGRIAAAIAADGNGLIESVFTEEDRDNNHTNRLSVRSYNGLYNAGDDDALTRDNLSTPIVTQIQSHDGEVVSSRTPGNLGFAGLIPSAIGGDVSLSGIFTSADTTTITFSTTLPTAITENRFNDRFYFSNDPNEIERRITIRDTRDNIITFEPAYSGTIDANVSLLRVKPVYRLNFVGTGATNAERQAAAAALVRRYIISSSTQSFTTNFNTTDVVTTNSIRLSSGSVLDLAGLTRVLWTAATHTLELRFSVSDNNNSLFRHALIGSVPTRDVTATIYTGLASLTGAIELESGDGSIGITTRRTASENVIGFELPDNNIRIDKIASTGATAAPSLVSVDDSGELIFSPFIDVAEHGFEDTNLDITLGAVPNGTRHIGGNWPPTSIVGTTYTSVNNFNAFDYTPTSLVSSGGNSEFTTLGTGRVSQSGQSYAVWTLGYDTVSEFGFAAPSGMVTGDFVTVIHGDEVFEGTVTVRTATSNVNATYNPLNGPSAVLTITGAEFRAIEHIGVHESPAVTGRSALYFSSSSFAFYSTSAASNPDFGRRMDGDLLEMLNARSFTNNGLGLTFNSNNIYELQIFNGNTQGQFTTSSGNAAGPNAHILFQPNNSTIMRPGQQWINDDLSADALTNRNFSLRIIDWGAASAINFGNYTNFHNARINVTERVQQTINQTVTNTGNFGLAVDEDAVSHQVFLEINDNAAPGPATAYYIRLVDVQANRYIVDTRYIYYVDSDGNRQPLEDAGRAALTNPTAVAITGDQDLYRLVLSGQATPDMFSDPSGFAANIATYSWQIASTGRISTGTDSVFGDPPAGIERTVFFTDGVFTHATFSRSLAVDNIVQADITAGSKTINVGFTIVGDANANTPDAPTATIGGTAVPSDQISYSGTNIIITGTAVSGATLDDAVAINFSANQVDIKSNRSNLSTRVIVNAGNILRYENVQGTSSVTEGLWYEILGYRLAGDPASGDLFHQGNTLVADAQGSTYTTNIINTFEPLATTIFAF